MLDKAKGFPSHLAHIGGRGQRLLPNMHILLRSKYDEIARKAIRDSRASTQALSRPSERPKYQVSSIKYQVSSIEYRLSSLSIVQMSSTSAAEAFELKAEARGGQIESRDGDCMCRHVYTNTALRLRDWRRHTREIYAWLGEEEAELTGSGLI